MGEIVFEFRIAYRVLRIALGELGLFVPGLGLNWVCFEGGSLLVVRCSLP